MRSLAIVGNSFRNITLKQVKSRAFAISSKVWVGGVEKSKSYRYVDKDNRIPVFADTIEMGSFLHEAKMLWSNLTWLSGAEI